MDTFAEILHGEPPPLSSAGIAVPAKVEAVIRRCLAKSPDERFRSADELAATFRGLLQEPDADSLLCQTETQTLATEPVQIFAARTRKNVAAARQEKSGRHGGLKWLIGCGLLTAVVFGLPAAVGVWLAATYGPNWLNWFQVELAKKHQWEEVARFWRPPPADAGPEILFPARVNAHQLVRHDSDANIRDLNIQAKRRRAVYSSDQNEFLLFVYRASKLEKEALFHRVCNAVLGEDLGFPSRPGNRDRQRSRGITGSEKDDYLSFDMSQGETSNSYGVLWWDKDWLFLARGTDPRPEAFLKDYLATLRDSLPPPNHSKEDG